MDKNAPALHPELVKISTLNLDPKNARLHGQRNLDVIGYSLGKFDQVKPIVVSRRTRTVIAGNGTLTEALEMGATEIVVTWVDRVHDEGEVREMTDADAAELAVLDNRSAELAEWDPDQLGATVTAFPEIEWDSGGWEPTDFADMGIEWPEPEIDEDTTTVHEHERDLPGDDDEDEIPDVPAEPVTQAGEVIVLGPHTLHCRDCMEVMAELADNSVDAIVTDPPYGLSPDGRARTWDDIEAMRADGKGPAGGFMGSAWDAGVPGITWARECLRVLKPGGYLAAYSATRTVHRLTCAVEDAGFEIIDQLNWLQWEAMPHGLNVSKAIDKRAGVERDVVGTRPLRASPNSPVSMSACTSEVELITVPSTDLAKHWDDYHTRLKPCAEPICLAQKPLEGTVVENIKKWGTGAMNIGATRHGENDPSWPGPNTPLVARDVQPSESRGVALGGSVDGSLRKAWRYDPPGRFTGNVFQYPKPARRERNAGTDGLPESAKAQSAGAMHANDDLSRRFLSAPMANIHPTVKPVKAMRRLLRLLLPPGPSVVLEPYGGSGTTLVAAADLDCRVILAEREPKYMDIVRARGEWSLDPERKSLTTRPVGKPRTKARDGDKRQARRRVQTLILNGTLPAPADVLCVDCQAVPGREYDHHLGYGAEHHEDVEALCAGCHHAREVERAKAKAPE